MSGMHPVPRLEIPAGATVELKPGGYHLMLMEVADGAIEVGKTVTLELTFEKSGKITVQAEVRAG
jgi:copper(I)-binding protein